LPTTLLSIAAAIFYPSNQIPYSTHLLLANHNRKSLPLNPYKPGQEAHITVQLHNIATMISDDQLYQLAIFLGSVSMLLIVLYHFLEVNAENDDKTLVSAERKADTVPGAKPVRS
ncbi:hypothetical protein KCU62_g5336, partial [Aureobasidium sp. EXF-3399]